MRFFKIGSNGGDGKFLPEMVGGWFYNGGDEKFFVSLLSWQTGSILPTPPPPSSFFKFCPTPSPLLPCHLQPPPQLFFLLSCFFGWMGDHATFDVLFYLMIIWIYTCQALVPWYQKDLDVCFMQQDIRFTEIWHIMWFFTGTLIWYHKPTNVHSTPGGQWTDKPI